MLLTCLLILNVAAAQVITNEVMITEAPKWLTASRVNRVVDKIQRSLEWNIRRVQVKWYADQAAFERAHGYGSAVLAVARRDDNAIWIGPGVNAENFDSTFGHELAHIIMFQKYRGARFPYNEAIPKWLEEGLANYVSKHGVIDYKYLAAQPSLAVRSLNHPFKNGEAKIEVKHHYMASSALMELLASKCRIPDLLQLSVGEKLEGYLSTFCGIPDLDAAYAKWIERKARGASGALFK